MDFHLRSGESWSSQGLEPGVTVILRTKDRPVLLRRAIGSISGQHYRNLTLCIINDGGDREDIEAAAASIPADLKYEIVHHDTPVGQPAALNVGLGRVTRQYFAIHDDDDTWAPDFLTRMIAFLELPANRRFIGAICHCERVIEDVRGGGIQCLRREPYRSYPPVLALADMLDPLIHPPPISHLMRQAAIGLAGSVNVDLPVMYDFEWTVRLLCKADIAALPQTLAGYHYRPNAGVSDPARNSVFNYEAEYSRIWTLLKNQLLREDLSTGRFGLGMASAFVDIMRSIQNRVDTGLSDPITDYLKQRARLHARRRQLRRFLEQPFRYLKKYFW